MTRRLNQLVLENKTAQERIEIGYMNCYFADGILRLREAGLELITAAELVEAQMLSIAQQHPAEGVLFTHELLGGIPVGENYNYLPNGDLLVATRGYSPILVNVLGYDKASHQRCPLLLQSPVLGLEERADRDPAKARERGVLHVPKSALRTAYSSDALTSEPLFLFLFGDKATMARDFLRDQRILSIDHRYPDFPLMGYRDPYVRAAPLLFGHVRYTDSPSTIVFGSAFGSNGCHTYMGMKRTLL